MSHELHTYNNYAQILDIFCKITECRVNKKPLPNIQQEGITHKPVNACNPLISKYSTCTGRKIM